MKTGSYAFCVAPMMDRTDRHCRFLHRLLSRRARLYTEMVTADAVRHGDRARLLDFDLAEHPVALQLGGSDPAALVEAARIGADFGYDEINLNVGCPSDRVQSGRFGACLMAEPELVARCVEAMAGSVDVPVTVKCRIGIDDQDSEQALGRFAAMQADAGAGVLIVHARKAWLKGLSPKENREVPPLDYDRVYRLKAAMPELNIVINGGITTLAEARGHLEHVDGVMVGRAAYHRPSMLADVDQEIFGDVGAPAGIDEVVRAYAGYVEAELSRGTPLAAMSRHLLGFYQAMPGARAWRRCLTERVRARSAGPEIILEALAEIERARPDGDARQAA